MESLTLDLSSAEWPEREHYLGRRTLSSGLQCTLANILSMMSPVGGYRATSRNPAGETETRERTEGKGNGEQGTLAGELTEEQRRALF
ncbi:unnamed protein product [Gadus morhua 'NCC']